MIAVHPIHSTPPARREVEPRANYRLYRAELREDFFAACGYCGDTDDRVDKSTFHIDHFAPKRRFAELELVYDNLVYSCRFCNISKSDHWIGDDPSVSHNGEKGFVDPCLGQFAEHVGRGAGGQIIGKTTLGKYMVRRLNLSLIRHELLWRARRARALRDEIDALIAEYSARGKTPPEYVALLERFRILTKSIDDYERRAVS